MTDLYYRPHLNETPGSLPFSALTPDGELRTDLANHPASIEECGFVLAPPRPDDTDTQTAEWDVEAEAWAMRDRPVIPEPLPDPFANFIPVALLRQRIEALGMWDVFASYLAQNPAEMLKVLTVEIGIDPAYPALATAFNAMDVPDEARSLILAPPSNGIGIVS